MIAVSDAWKAAHKQTILPETFVEITMDAFDTEVPNDISSVIGDPAASFSNSQAVVNALSYPQKCEYALLEQNMWLLDGSKQVLSGVGSYTAPGYVSEKDTTSVITAQTKTKRENEIPGFTIVWAAEYNEYATDFVVSVYNDSSLVASKSVSNNDSVTSVVPLPITSAYNKVTVTINQWNVPNHRKRIDSLCYGFHWVFGKNDIISFSHEQSGDVLSAEVSRNEIVFSLDNSRDLWNPINPQGLGRYLSEQQRVSVRYGMDVNGTTEWIPGGQFFLTEWNASSNGMEANFVARDILGLMENLLYSRSAIEGVGRNPYSNAGVIYQDPDRESGETGEAVVTGEEYLIYDRTWPKPWSRDDPYSEHVTWYKIALKSDPNKKQGWIPHRYLDMTSFTYGRDVLWSSILENAKTLPDFEAVTSSSGYWALATPIRIDNVTTAEMVQMIANSMSCRHNVDRNGVLHLEFEKEGLALSDYVISLDFSKIYPEVNLTKPLGKISALIHPVGESEHDTREQSFGTYGSGAGLCVDNRLIGEFTIDYGVWIAEILSNRTVVTGEFRADPRLDLFDVVKVETKYGTLTPVVITRIKYTFSGTFWGTFEGRLIDL